MASPQLSPEAQQAFCRDGFVVIDACLAPDVLRALEAECRALSHGVDLDETDCVGRQQNGAAAAPTFSVSVSQSIASTGVLTTVTHADVATNARALLVGDKVTVSGHTGDAANLAMNQVFTVSAVNSGTETVLRSATYASMTPATYNAGTIVMAVSKAEFGNKCHVECSNRGLCDNKVGTCACFKGFHGNACQLQDVLAVL